MQGDGDIEAVGAVLLEIRGCAVIFDTDLARYFGVETRALNQAVKRNEERFDGFAFVLTDDEFSNLKSQNVMSSTGHGGRRTPPWAFTEHGVVMAATVLNSERAVKASRRIVKGFVARRASSALRPGTPMLIERIDTSSKSDLLLKMRHYFDALMNVEVNPKLRKTLRQETEEFIAEGIGNLKARLKKDGLENEEIEARVLKYLAEADEIRARTATERQMTEKQRIKNQANQLRFLIRAELAMTSGEVSALLEVLDDLGRD